MNASAPCCCQSCAPWCSLSYSDNKEYTKTLNHEPNILVDQMHRASTCAAVLLKIRKCVYFLMDTFPPVDLPSVAQKNRVTRGEEKPAAWDRVRASLLKNGGLFNVLALAQRWVWSNVYTQRKMQTTPLLKWVKCPDKAFSLVGILQRSRETQINTIIHH